MTGEKFYHFEEDAGVSAVGEGKKSKVTPVKVIVGLLIVALAAALIGVLIYYNTGDRKSKNEQGSAEQQTGSDSTTKQSTYQSTSTTTLTSTIPPSTDELLQRTDCIPEAKGQNVNVTEALCFKRGCIFDENDYGIDAPHCFFSSEKMGYKVSNYQTTGLGFKCDLDLKGQGPFGLDLNHMEFEVQMLGDNIIRFKVRKIFLFTFYVSFIFKGKK